MGLVNSMLAENINMKTILLLLIAVSAHCLSVEELSLQLAKNPMWSNGMFNPLKIQGDNDLTLVIQNIAVQSGKIGPVIEWGKVEEMKIHYDKDWTETIHACRIVDDKGDAIIAFNKLNGDMGWWYRVFR